MPIHLDFIIRRFGRAGRGATGAGGAAALEGGREKDGGWFSAAMVKHYPGDDATCGSSSAASSPPSRASRRRLRRASTRSSHGTNTRRGSTIFGCAFAPMVELLRPLEAHRFTNYIASGGDRDFMRPVAGSLYGVPPERVIGSALALEYRARASPTRLHKAGGRLPRRRRTEAGPDLEPDRPATDPGHRQLEW